MNFWLLDQYERVSVPDQLDNNGQNLRYAKAHIRRTNSDASSVVVQQGDSDVAQCFFGAFGTELTNLQRVGYFKHFECTVDPVNQVLSPGQVEN